MESDCPYPFATTLERGVGCIRESVRHLSDKPGVYQMMNDKGDILYIGKARRLKQRVITYAQVGRLPQRLKRMIAALCKIEIIETHTETEALLLESNLIKRHQPPYNVLLKDDKSFPYIFLTEDHSYPRLGKYRGDKQPQTRYFGPFASSQAVDETLNALYKVFQLRSCTDTFFTSRQRPCLQYYIKRCTAPCVGKISCSDYQTRVQQTLAFFKGKTDQVQQDLSKRMMKASDALNYEEAAQIRDRLKLLTQIQSRQRINIEGLRDADVIALVQDAGKACVQVFFYRHGRHFGNEAFFLDHLEDATPEEGLQAFIMQFYQAHPPPHDLFLSHTLPERSLIQKALRQQHGTPCSLVVPLTGPKRGLVDHALHNARESIRRHVLQHQDFRQFLIDIQMTFHLSNPLERVEIYDNSHIQGAHPYGVMVVATADGFDRKAYRKFTISDTVQPGDDYGMMREVMQRRFARAHEAGWTLPDLIIIDGGLGQLNAVKGIIDKLDVEGIELLAIAKGPERNAGRETFFRPNEPSTPLPPTSPVLYFLQRLRDEAHRFAIGSHRLGRAKALTKSALDEIPGVGPSRKKSLLLHFGSARAVGRAALMDLENVPGISKALASKIYAYFHGH